MNYVTPEMIAEHVGRDKNTVRRAAKKHGTPMINLGGTLGLRIAAKDAQKLVDLYWPGKGPLPMPGINLSAK